MLLYLVGCFFGINTGFGGFTIIGGADLAITGGFDIGLTLLRGIYF